MQYSTKDSGKREEFDSGMVRDTQEGKARFDLLFPKDVNYYAQMLTRTADLMERGMAKYGERNWEKANSIEERDRARASAMRHMVQWISGQEDEDHAAAVIFNIIAAETINSKLEKKVVTILNTEEVDPNLPSKNFEEYMRCAKEGCFMRRNAAIHMSADECGRNGGCPNPSVHHVFVGP